MEKGRNEEGRMEEYSQISGLRAKEEGWGDGECSFDVELEVPVEDGALDGITELSTGLVKCWFSGSTPRPRDLYFKKCCRWFGCSQSIVV